MMYRISVQDPNQAMPIVVYVDADALTAKVAWYKRYFPHCTVSVTPKRTVGELLKDKSNG